MKESVIFDLDGTLWNSTQRILPCWNSVIKRHPEVDKTLSLDDILGIMGKTPSQITETFFPGVPHEISDSIVYECAREEVYPLREHGGILYDELDSTLHSLAEKYTLCIVSNCLNGYIEAFLDYHHFRDIFTDFENAEHTDLTKGENIRRVCLRNGFDRAVYVGDTASDREAADIAGIPFIHASYGFGQIPDCKYSIKCPRELLTVIPMAMK